MKNTESSKAASIAANEESCCTLERYLAENGELVYRTNGTSMRPIIYSGKDIVRIAKKDENERCKKYDVALYHYPETPNRYVLHRIVAVRANDYVMLGDNCRNREFGIRDEDIVGVLREIIKPHRVLHMDGAWMKLYARVWVFLYPVRRGAMVCRSCAAHILKRIL